MRSLLSGRWQAYVIGNLTGTTVSVNSNRGAHTGIFEGLRDSGVVALLQFNDAVR